MRVARQRGQEGEAIAGGVCAFKRADAEDLQQQ